MKKIVIIGTGKNAKQVYDFLKIHKLYDIVGFAIDKEYIKEDSYMNYPVYPLENLDVYIDNDTYIFVSLGWNRLNSDRRQLYERLKAKGYKFANLISPTAIVRGKIDGDNVWINDYSVLQSDAVIKSDVIIREGVVIGNDTLIKDHCFIGVKALVAGGCIIGEQSFIGIHATVFDGTIIGDKCIIGGCAVVKRNVSNYTVCKYDLNNTITKKYDESVIEQKLVFSKNVR